jgi:GntP family gluconate:H+ symporter
LATQLIILLAAIAFIVVTTAKWKFHPFLALLFAAYGVAWAAGLPAQEIGKTISNGFGQTLSGIGLVIVVGTLIGTALEQSGATLRIAGAVFGLLGQRRPTWGMGWLGYLVSIAVFCDSGFIILASLNRALAAKTNTPLPALSVALGMGLLATHALVPPTPGPVAAADTLGADLPLVIGLNLLIALSLTVVGILFANYLIKKLAISPPELVAPADERATSPVLPRLGFALAPILVPILLMSLGTVGSLAFPAGQSAGASGLLAFLGMPVNALVIGMLCCAFLLPRDQPKALGQWVGRSLLDAAPVLVITAMGGALGATIKLLPLQIHLATAIEGLGGGGQLVGALLAFGVAALLKTAQGSSTVAIVTTSAIMAPLLPALGLDGGLARALLVAIIGSGALTVSHANDSFFWVVAQFGQMDARTAYRTHTLGTLLIGLTGLVVSLGLLLALA